MYVFTIDKIAFTNFLFFSLLITLGRSSRINNSVPVISVFTQGESGYAAFRIPGVLVAGDGSLLAVAEGRKYGCDDFAGKHDIVSKRSTDDGITWSPLNLVADAELLFGCHSYNSTPVGLCQFWDPTPVLDTSSNDIFLLAAYTSAADTSARRNADNDIFLWRSQDHGVSFTPDPNNFNISKMFGDRPRGTPANGHGIQLRSGRLLVPSYGHFGAAPSGSSVMYSDDHGRSWEVTSSFAPGSAEGDVAELNDGTVIYSMRSEIVPMSGCGDYFHCRLTARSLDKGLTFQNLTSEPSLPDPRSKGGIATTPKGVCVFANDANDENRTNVTVKVSRDGGYTWNEGQEVYTGMAGYVDVITKRETKAFVVYEKDECSIVVSPVKV